MSFIERPRSSQLSKPINSGAPIDLEIVVLSSFNSSGLSLAPSSVSSKRDVQPARSMFAANNKPSKTILAGGLPFFIGCAIEVTYNRFVVRCLYESPMKYDLLRAAWA